MNTLSYRPNLLFLIWIRNKHHLFILNHKLNRNLYYRKLIIALTTKQTGNCVNGGTYIIWRVNSKKHRDDVPSHIYGISKKNPNGTYHIYYKNEKIHREDGPAVIYGISNENPNGTKNVYYINGELHRDDGPAFINGISKENPDGTYHQYYINGKQVNPF